MDVPLDLQELDVVFPAGILDLGANFIPRNPKSQRAKETQILAETKQCKAKVRLLTQQAGGESWISETKVVWKNLKPT